MLAGVGEERQLEVAARRTGTLQSRRRAEGQSAASSEQSSDSEWAITRIGNGPPDATKHKTCLLACFLLLVLCAKIVAITTCMRYIVL